MIQTQARKSIVSQIDAKLQSTPLQLKKESAWVMNTISAEIANSISADLFRRQRDSLFVTP